MANLQFTTIDRILVRIQKYIKDTGISENDIIEWAGEALEFLKTVEIQEQAVKFLKVENYEADVPMGFQMVLQVAKYNKDAKEIENDCSKKEIQEEDVDLKCPDCCGKTGLIDFLFSDWSNSYRPYFDMQWQYIDWTVSKYYKENFTPIRLSNHALFNSIVCKEKAFEKDCYGEHEYTIVGLVDKKLRFSFKEGYVALAYVKNAIDRETGLPLIPDHEQHLAAIQYYLLWKIAELLDWKGREGYAQKANTNMQLWLKYVKQAKNFAKMPKTIDQFQNLLESTHHLIPRHKRYYKYFGNLGRAEDRRFSNPNRY